MGIKWKDGYSADVSLYLVIGDESFDVAQVGPDFLVLSENRDIESCFAELVVVVDGRKTKYPIVLDGTTIENPTINYFVRQHADAVHLHSVVR